MPSANAVSPSTAMLQMLVGSWVSQALYVVAKLGIADLVHERPRSCDALAKATETNEGALYRVLRALASLGVFTEETDGRFHLTPLADCLRTDTAGSLRAFAIMLGEQEHWRAWGAVMHSVRTGEPAFDHVFGMPHFRYFAGNAEAAGFFNEGMASRAGDENDAIVAAYDFSKFATVIDVGGGQGTLLMAILRAALSPTVMLFDLPHVIAARRATVEQAHSASRYQFSQGDFFEAVPRGADVYILKKIIHDWNDERAITILRNCRKAMTGAARLLLIEPIIPSGNASSFNKLLDLMMLVWTTGGKERTEAEHRTLLDAAGLKLVRTIRTNCPLVIVEAVPHEVESPSRAQA